MKNKISLLDTETGRRTVWLYAIAFCLILIPLWVGITDNIPMIIALFSGVVLFLYTLLYPWGKVRYYAMMSVAFLVLLILLIKFGIGMLVDMQLPGHSAEGIAMTVGMLCVAGIIAGIIGLFTFAPGRE
jgi:hypothetical protein